MKPSKRIKMFERFISKDYEASKEFQNVIKAMEQIEQRADGLEGVHNKWLHVISRIQSVGRSRNVIGQAIVSINVIINDRGVPLLWTEPKCTLIEPMKDNRELLDLLSKNL